MKTLNQRIRATSPARRKKIARRAAQLIAEEMSLRELRRAHKLTQERIAETLASVRTRFPAWNSAAIFCSPPSAATWKLWEAG